MSEQEEVLMAEYRQGWASRAAQVLKDYMMFTIREDINEKKRFLSGIARIT